MRHPDMVSGFWRNYMYYNHDMPHDTLLSDEQVVTRVCSGDKDLFRELVRRYEEKLMRYAIYLVRSSDKAQDIVQESFINAYKNLNGFNSKLKFSSWIYRIVHNEAINHVKKYRKDVTLTEAVNTMSDENIEQNFERKEVIERAHLCLTRLPISYSEPLALYYLEDKSYEEISDIMRIPMGTVATRINRAKGIMKALCEKSG